jgi:hypothetical protein
MKKIILLATAALLITGVTFADKGKKKKCCEKATASCCAKSGKSCKKDKEKTETVKETTVKL